MDLVGVGLGAVVGAVAGTAMRSAVLRLSVAGGPGGIPACRRCAAPVPPAAVASASRSAPWAPPRCGGCAAPLLPPLALELGTAATLALIGGHFGLRPEVLAFACFGVLGVALSAVDIAVQRLPDRLTLPAYPVLLALLGMAALVEADGAALVRALAGAAALAGCYLLLALLRPGQLGGGDIKLAGLAGLVLGWSGWPALILGGALGFVLSAAVSLVLLAARRITLHSSIPFGPSLLCGALLAVLATAPALDVGA